MNKERLKSKVRYEPPQVELINLGRHLHLLESFSIEGGTMDDWNGDSDPLDTELGDLSGGADWGNGGGVLTD